MTDPVSKEMQALAEWVCQRLDAGSDPDDVALAIDRFVFEVADSAETMH